MGHWMGGWLPSKTHNEAQWLLPIMELSGGSQLLDNSLHPCEAVGLASYPQRVEMTPYKENLHFFLNFLIFYILNFLHVFVNPFISL